MSETAVTGAVGGDSSGEGGSEASVSEQPQEGFAQDGGQDGQSVEETQEGAAQQKLKVKVDGKTQEITPEELDAKLREFQKHGAAERRLEDAARLRKELQAAAHTLQNDPVGFMRQVMGESQFQTFLRSEVERAINYELMPKGERERMEWQERQRALEEENSRYKQAEMDRQTAHAATQYKAQFQKDFGTALQSVGFDASPENIREMAGIAKKMVSEGRQWSPQMVAEAFAKRMSQYDSMAIGARKTKYEKLSETELESEFRKEFGDAALEKLRKASLAKPRGFQQSQQQPEVQQSAPVDVSKRKYMRLDDLREEIERGKR